MARALAVVVAAAAVQVAAVDMAQLVAQAVLAVVVVVAAAEQERATTQVQIQTREIAGPLVRPGAVVALELVHFLLVVPLVVGRLPAVAEMAALVPTQELRAGLLGKQTFQRLFLVAAAAQQALVELAAQVVLVETAQQLPQVDQTQT